MKKKNLMFGVFLLGMLFLTVSLTNSVATEDEVPGEEEPGESDPPIEEEPEVPDDDNPVCYVYYKIKEKRRLKSEQEKNLENGEISTQTDLALNHR